MNTYLKNQMEQSNTTIKVLATACSWTQGAISQLRLGQRPISIRQAVKLEKAGKRVGCPLAFEKLVPEDAAMLKSIGFDREVKSISQD